MTQHIRVLYFASLSEKLQTECEEVPFTDLPSPATVAGLRHALAQRGEDWQTLNSATVKCAVNLAVVPDGHTLNPADEVAFFPPVTGG